ncbi:MAG: hypothetical protein JWO85_1215 [Candidatus Eremiobacteraeota bacterium]|nr:hypothetical protein [Candidatus Eremiobacteraeota bacterium]
MKKIAVLAGLALLTACGSGGGGSAPIPGGGSPTTHAALKAGFSGIGRAGASADRHAMALSGGIVPIADFIVPDSFITAPPASFPSAVAVAFYDPSQGPVPTQLPAIVWTQAGIPVTFSTPAVPVTLSGMTVAGETQLAAPIAVGQVTLTGTPSNGDPAVTLAAYAFGGTGVTTASGGRNGMQQCVSFTAGSQSTTGSSGDICIALDGSGNPQVAVALGAILVAKPIDAVTVSDAAGLGSSPTTITQAAVASAFATSGVEPTIIAHTASGALVGWAPFSQQIGAIGAIWYGYYKAGL